MKNKKAFTLIECLFALFILSLIVVSLFPHLMTLTHWKEELDVQEEEFHEEKRIIHLIKNKAYENKLGELEIDTELSWSLERKDLGEGLEKIIIHFPKEKGEEIYEIVISH